MGLRPRVFSLLWLPEPGNHSKSSIVKLFPAAFL